MTTPANPVAGSLQGLRVVELGTSVAAPMAGQILGDLGAEVIKVERVGRGDDSRSWAPPDWDEESIKTTWFGTLHILGNINRITEPNNYATAMSCMHDMIEILLKVAHSEHY